MRKGKVPAPPGLKRHDKIVAKIVKQLKEKLIMPKVLKEKLVVVSLLLVIFPQMLGIPWMR